MRAPLLILLILLVVNVLTDLYIYRRSASCANPLWKRLQAASAVAGLLIIGVAIALPARKGPETLLTWKMWALFSYLTLYIPKYVGIICDWLASLPLLWHKKRVKALTAGGIVLGTVTFAAMWWGALINRFNIQVNEVTVEIAGLPEAFDGMTIAQFSDLHTGTFGSDTTFTSALVDRINGLDPDLIVFTGDIVNRESTEADPFVSTLSRLYAPMGVAAILGNHDYGDYRDWDSAEEKQANMEHLYSVFSKAGIDLLLNETRWLRRGNDSIALIGVENIGDPPFKIYGSLKSSYPDISDSNTKILLTHNPQHWVDSIAEQPGMNIALTLSGHTHAMQMSAGHVSPAVFRYPTWGGLYHDSTDHAESRKLYVNIGAGTVGLPMRMGATPEITLLTLRSAEKDSK
ncbi:MAG: metallophosphoesterase [Muribaculaceae bacterium]|nr:metallophosphoesterase [Muribaculaceae bacterium]